jgi:hypothetical protein
MKNLLESKERRMSSDSRPSNPAFRAVWLYRGVKYKSPRGSEKPSEAHIGTFKKPFLMASSQKVEVMALLKSF